MNVPRPDIDTNAGNVRAGELIEGIEKMTKNSKCRRLH